MVGQNVSHEFTIDVQDDTEKFIAVHNWIVQHGWQIKVDYDWTTVIGVRTPSKIIVNVHDDQNAMLFKLSWV